MPTDIVVELLGGSAPGTDFSTVDNIHVTDLKGLSNSRTRGLKRISRGVGPNLFEGDFKHLMAGVLDEPTVNKLDADIRAVPDRGRILIIGYSLGTFAALALTKKLNDADVTPDYVALMDLPITTNGWTVPIVNWSNAALFRPVPPDIEPGRTPSVPARTKSVPVVELPALRVKLLHNFHQLQGNGCVTDEKNSHVLRFASGIGAEIRRFRKNVYGEEVHGVIRAAAVSGTTFNSAVVIAPQAEDEKFHEELCLNHRFDTWVPVAVSILDAP